VRHRFLTFTLFVCGTLCVATGALWARSHFRDDYMTFNAHWLDVESAPSYRRTFYLSSSDGSLSINAIVESRPAGVIPFTEDPCAGELGWHWTSSVRDPSSGERVRMVGRFGRTYQSMNGGFLLYLDFPHWLAALIMVAPIVALRLRRPLRHRCSDFGCRNCGYDLRATPQRCPECGTKTEFRVVSV
jgi:hypothetical protein